ncbi:hypothetical protein KCH_17490 [Kitasatospora cheerisanensis KCTC 2395]|uniref:Uncharacterized protein n=1 Tax=Kitasatospora cheerisanensis KCTC 2395 TaxID=1348663 RepID=A0A066YYZ7_9ACTN|nr:hypothetical protein KCH_17490 [Kitasatospora cheerisanensis KCTC 2395]
MHGPALVNWLLAALAAGSGGYYGWRARRGRRAGASCGDGAPARRESDVLEAAMGLGMAGMALLPGVAWGWPYALLAAVLLAGALAGRGRRCGRTGCTTGSARWRWRTWRWRWRAVRAAGMPGTTGRRAGCRW